MVKVFSLSVKSEFYNCVTPQRFFEFVKSNGIKGIIDIRRSAAKSDNGIFQDVVLPYICNLERVDYQRNLQLAPPKELFKRCDDEKWNMLKYAKEYLTENIVGELKSLSLEMIDGKAFMCSENALYNCHRWICVEAVKAMYKDKVEIEHLGLIRYKRNGEHKGAIPYDVELKSREYIESIFG